MPPDRDVEFLIDLMTGTGPIAKRPYMKDVEELKELKKQLRSNWTKGSSNPVHRHGEHMSCLWRRKIAARYWWWTIVHSMR